MRALIVEDDARYGAHLKQLFERHGFLADWRDDADEALELGFEPHYAVIVLDLMLSAKGERFGRAVDGFSLLRRWRKKGVDTPVLVLTASRTDVEDTTLSYEWDADYEIKRPGEEFDALLLAWARSRSARTRNGASASASGRISRYGPLSIDHELSEVRYDGKVVGLSRTEFNVLLCLVKEGGAWLTVNQIADRAFDANTDNPTAQVYEYVKRLRQKVGFDAIRNQRGRGYRFALADSVADSA